MKTKLVLTKAKAYYFEAIDENGNICKLTFNDKKKEGLCTNIIVEVEAEYHKYLGSSKCEYEFKSLIAQYIADGRDKVIAEAGIYKPGDAYEQTYILNVGKEFIINGKKVQYLYFK
jgi:hypothetical protein